MQMRSALSGAIFALCALVLLHGSSADDWSFEVKVFKPVPGRPGQQEPEAWLSSTTDAALRVEFGDTVIASIPLSVDEDGFRSYVPGETIPGSLTIRRTVPMVEVVSGFSPLQQWYAQGMDCVTSAACTAWPGSVAAVRRDVTVAVINGTSGEPDSTLRYHACWPVRYEGPRMDSASAAAPTETVELRCATMQIAQIRPSAADPPPELPECLAVHAAQMAAQAAPQGAVVRAAVSVGGVPERFSAVAGGALGVLTTSRWTPLVPKPQEPIRVTVANAHPIFAVGGGLAPELAAVPPPDYVDPDDDNDGIDTAFARQAARAKSRAARASAVPRVVEPVDTWFPPYTGERATDADSKEHVLLRRGGGAAQQAQREVVRSIETLVLQGAAVDIGATVATMMDDSRVYGSISPVMAALGELCDSAQDLADPRLAISVDSFFDIFTEFQDARNRKKGGTMMGAASNPSYRENPLASYGEQTLSNALFGLDQDFLSLVTTGGGTTKGGTVITINGNNFKRAASPGHGGDCDDRDEGRVLPVKIMKRIDQTTPLLMTTGPNGGGAVVTDVADVASTKDGSVLVAMVQDAAPGTAIEVEVEQCPENAYACWDGTCRVDQGWCPAPVSAGEWAAWRRMMEGQVYDTLRGEPDALQIVSPRDAASGQATGRRIRVPRDPTTGLPTGKRIVSPRDPASGLPTGKRIKCVSGTHIATATLGRLSYKAADGSVKTEECLSATKMYEGAFPTLLSIPPLDASTVAHEAAHVVQQREGVQTVQRGYSWTIEVRVQRIEMK